MNHAGSLLDTRFLQRARGLLVAATASAALFAGCGSNSDGDLGGYSKLVVFGDSLSDVGSYATPGVAAQGGGKYTINGAGNKIWVEQIASRIGVAAPCAAQTGLNASGPLAALAAPVTDVPACYGYAQGGARVTEPVGPTNQALLALGDASGALGGLTDPVVNQVSRHLAKTGGRFSDTDLVAVLAGANDVFMNLAAINAVAAGGGDVNAAAAQAVAAMGTAGTELAALVRGQMLAKGAFRVALVTVPDINLTPFGATLDAASKALVQQMTTTFNAKLLEGLQGADGLLVVDGYALSRAVAQRPADFGIGNATVPACDATLAPLGSLTCTAATTLVAVDVSSYQFADSVHPTPLGHAVFAKAVIDRMVAVGWL